MSSRRIVIQVLILAIAMVFTIRLFSIQIVNDDYKLAAQNNIIQKIVEYPYRGLVYDRNGKLVVYNTPVYDLMIVPKELNLADSAKICQLIGMDHATFMMKYQKARRYSAILSSKLQDQIPNHEFARIQDELVNIPGLYPLPRTVREYPENTLANALGYVREISRYQLDRDTSGYYHPGDYTGIKGIELEYENALRGKRGMSYKIVNVQGVVKGAFKDGELDSSSIPGKSIHLTIDSELQRYAEILMEGKVGSVVALDPKTGEILAYVSAPSYNPNLLSGRDLGKNYLMLQEDSLKPLFNRPIQAMYPPGSMFKTVQTLIAMQEGVLGPYEKIMCDYSPMGDHAPKGIYDVDRAIALSSNTFLYKIFRRVMLQDKNPNVYIDSRIGLENWNNQVRKFGLGSELGVDLPGEKSGNVPTVAYYDRVYGTNRWKFSNIYSLSIGQGEIQVTPIQMANLSAILANRGYYYTPHIVREIDGEPTRGYAAKHTDINAEYFEPVISGMENTVLRGTGFRARITDIIVCGKTSTVENPHGEDHSGFMAFAPKDNPQISVAVYVENAGQGARAAASTAGLVIEKYLKGEISRPWIEEYVLKGDFSDFKPVKKKTTVDTTSAGSVKPATNSESKKNNEG
ncbi:penicillin-binding protein 2 [Marinoscillum sp. MHG1-6]|uniref:peptidoglycan D,D-transpeptidase FtsI family protein n=1 Tax=Marinoscillum sp. MHG1-6 TaxID=2959627 RepID=UPI002157ED0B|nr:penicillin-binding transpeptidase domain-containing protein [Marinoscillum sp. MHG1-6]